VQKYQCMACEYIYDPAEGDPDAGVEPGTAFEDLPDDWERPDCGVGKDMFEPTAEQPDCRHDAPRDCLRGASDVRREALPSIRAIGAIRGSWPSVVHFRVFRS